MRTARFEGDAQRLAGAEQVGLADDFVDRLRPHAFCERGRGLGREEILHGRVPEVATG